MAFERTGKRVIAAHPDHVSIALNQNKANKSIVVRIGTNIAKNCGFKLGGRAEIFWGTDEDQGTFMLADAEEGYGVKWKDENPQLMHVTTRLPDWILPFAKTDGEIISQEKGELLLKVPPFDEPMKRAPLKSSDIQRPKTAKEVFPPDEQPGHPAEEPGGFVRQTKRRRKF